MIQIWNFQGSMVTGSFSRRLRGVVTPRLPFGKLLRCCTCTRFLQLPLHPEGFRAAESGSDDGRRIVHHSLRILQTQTGQHPDHLNGREFSLTGTVQHHRPVGLDAACSRSRGNSRVYPPAIGAAHFVYRFHGKRPAAGTVCTLFTHVSQPFFYCTYWRD